MIVDSSALLAVVLREADEERFARALLAAPALRISAANWVEATIAVDGRDPAVASRFEDLMAFLGMEIVPVSVDQAYRARVAYREYGRGYHAARLNYGDCFAYALAKDAGEALLFKGGDFAQTDIEPALRG